MCYRLAQSGRRATFGRDISSCVGSQFFHSPLRLGRIRITWEEIHLRSHARTEFRHGPSSQQGLHHRLRPRRLHRRHLFGARQPGAHDRRRHAARRPDDHHHRCRELPRLRRRRTRPLADGADAEASRACRDAHDPRRDHGGRFLVPPVPGEGRFRRHLFGRYRHRVDRRASTLARPGGRAEVHGLRRVGLRHLRRIFLPRAGGGSDRRRQYRGRGGPLPDQSRQQSHARPPPRFAALGENPAGPPLCKPQGRGPLGQCPGRHHGR